jgi:hypothetical protein
MSADIMLIVYSKLELELTFSGQIDFYTAFFDSNTHVITNGNPVHLTQSQWNTTLEIGVYGIRSETALTVPDVTGLTKRERATQKDPWPNPPPGKTTNFSSLTSTEWNSMTTNFMHEAAAPDDLLEQVG